MIKTTKIDTPLGEMVAGATEDGACLLEFTGRRVLPTEVNDPEWLLDHEKKYSGKAVDLSLF